jgi:hypothetical protein
MHTLSLSATAHKHSKPLVLCQQVERETACRVSLEKAVIEQRAVKLQREALRLARQRAFLREERKRAREEETAISEDKDSLEHVKKADWWPVNYLVGAGQPDERLRLRVGGQVFEVAKKFLQQDPGSLLNALCSEDCPLFEYQGEVDREQTVVVDRDWWLFRFVTIFLRDGLVPEDRCTALQLYREAAFWRLESLQRAIEETHLNLTRTDLNWKDGALKGDTMDDDDMFWKNKKNWWKSQAKKSSKDDEPLKPEWWMDYGEVSASNSTDPKWNIALDKSACALNP